MSPGRLDVGKVETENTLPSFINLTLGLLLQTQKEEALL